MTKKYPFSVISAGNRGHTLHHCGVFSPDGQWIVFDGRNADDKIGETGEIGLINLLTGEEQILYTCANQSQFGPGVGAASFSPSTNQVIFIHGLANANKQKPYAIHRRTGVGIRLNDVQNPFNYDARDILSPYVPGSLRGGTHAHNWSGDGELISFTYNDELVAPELRTVGVMIPFSPGIRVKKIRENLNGKYYSAIIAQVKAEPKWGSNEINKAFDECWIGREGYLNANGKKIRYAIAFQGNVINAEGKVVTEVFTADIEPSKILADQTAVGKPGERPQVPEGIDQTRLTFTEKGLSNTRHWLRSSADGKYIYALAKDENERDQIVEIETLTGKMRFLTQQKFGIDFSFNFSTDNQQIAFVSDNRLWLMDKTTASTIALTHPGDYQKIVGAPSFSPKGDLLVFNAFLQAADGKDYLHILKIDLD